MATYRGEEKSGKIGDVIYSSWHGRPYVRRRPEAVANPQTEAQQGHRYAFAAISKLSSDLKSAHLIGLHKSAQREKLNTHSLFRKINKGCYCPDGIDYARVVVSKGPLDAVGIISAEVDDQRVLRLTFEGHLTLKNRNDKFHLSVYCPDLRDCRLARPVLRSEGLVAVDLPAEWTGHDLHIYAFLCDRVQRTSGTMYAMIAAK